MNDPVTGAPSCTLHCESSAALSVMHIDQQPIGSDSESSITIAPGPTARPRLGGTTGTGAGSSSSSVSSVQFPDSLRAALVSSVILWIGASLRGAGPRSHTN